MGLVNQRADLGVLAHIEEKPRLSLGSYGRPRMTEELKELGLSVRRLRIGRLIKNIKPTKTLFDNKGTSGGAGQTNYESGGISPSPLR